MKLFDFIKVFFGNNKEYKSIRRYDKAKNRFMINRFFSISYPVQAESLNLNGTDAANVIDAWHLVASQYTRTPGWIYTKVRKGVSIKETGYEPGEDVVKFYMNRFKISSKDYAACLLYNKKELYEQLESIEREMQANKNL